ncbi:riboflavin synthase [Vallitalea okinawensis]|uniref:riboflavin synthase n=1 Tax=Vallitalea okinawensis TaxID=2078660 RepID=UPI000CFAA8D8|nr:riboflavin synthase [Vallitalea okinawensis]
MFTGIIEETGVVLANHLKGDHAVIKVKADIVLQDLKLGDSIATNGVCLTVTEKGSDYFVADIMPETYKMTNLKEQKIGNIVNLEKALRLSTPLGGHLVSGHIDGMGKIIGIRNEGNAKRVAIEVDKELLKYMIQKGSVTLDGTSLTLAKLNTGSFEVGIIPHTSGTTTLDQKRVGDQLNIECDMIGKYVYHFLHQENKGNRNMMDLLGNSGFLG